MPHKYEPQPRPERAMQILVRTAKIFYITPHLPKEERRRLMALRGEELDAALAEHGLALSDFDREAAMPASDKEKKE